MRIEPPFAASSAAAVLGPPSAIGTTSISAKGKAATAEGVFEKIAANDHEAREAAAEQLGQSKKDAFGQTYQVKVTGAVIK